MTHDRAESRLLDLAYGELPPDEAREVERHAAGCSRCTAQLAELLAARRLAARLAAEPVPARGRAELLAAARRAVAPAPPRRAGRTHVYALAASAAVIALAAGVALQLTRERAPGRVQDEARFSRDLAPLEEAAPHDAPGPVATPAARAPAGATSSPAVATRPSPASAAASARQAPAEAPGRRAPPFATPTPLPPGRMAAQRQAAPAPAHAPAETSSAYRERSDASAPERARTHDRPAAHPAGVRVLVADLERRAAAGELHKEARQLTCAGAPIERVALLDGARVVKLTVHSEDGSVQEGWYDGAGALLALRRSDGAGAASLPAPSGESGAGAAPAGTSALPARAPDAGALARCGW